ncbi:phosphotransferase [Paraburkholderia tropica]|uniref:Hydroxylysine kinase n=2 Tax=Bacteria TaxID=2 RepID=A0AAQ1GK82_9BURK|nr:phosphotransferase [Paraburkholderia tropica]SEK07796.1 Ser/Thr protein kinase RdoA involved in Cpx stress response, MazF antagonist [Paraburkholderia tropica]
MNALQIADPLAEAAIDVGTLSAEPDEISLVEAERIAREHYGIIGEAHRLTGERDQNFRIVDRNAQSYALRISNPAEDPAMNDFQIGALLHIAMVDPDLPVPKVCPSVDGETHLVLRVNGGERAVRMLTFLDGVPMNTTARSLAQTEAMARTLARLGLALRGYFHPSAGHTIAWDIKNLGTLHALLRFVADEEQRKVAQHFFDHFEREVKPVLSKLRAQVVHNDLNVFNALVDPNDHDRIVGVLDFGDMVFTPLAVDIAVGASFHLSMPGDPWDAATTFIAAYHAITPLEGVELDLMYDLIAARCVATLLITGWRAQRHPENSAYILKNYANAWRGLSHFLTLPREVAQQRLRDACNLEKLS